MKSDIFINICRYLNYHLWAFFLSLIQFSGLICAIAFGVENVHALSALFMIYTSSFQIFRHVLHENFGKSKAWVSLLLKGTVKQVERSLVKDDHLHVSKVSKNFGTPTIYNFAVIHPWNLLFSLAYFLKPSPVSIVFHVYKQNFTAQWLKSKNSYECENLSVCYLCWSDHMS